MNHQKKNILKVVLFISQKREKFLKNIYKYSSKSQKWYHMFVYIAEQIFEKKIIESGYFYMRVNERYINCDRK